MSEGGPQASFPFRVCVGAFVELPTGIAREILPGDLQPVEPHHGSSVLSAMAFDFYETPFGNYRELVLGIVVAPRVAPGAVMPRSAFFPFSVACTSQTAREYAASSFHLPYYQGDVEIDIDNGDEELTVTLSESGRPVVEMTATEHLWRPVDHPYQSFMRDGAILWTADIRMIAEFSENEEERGSLTLHPHLFISPLPVGEVEPTPFREQLMRNGAQIVQQPRRVDQTTRP